jgi:hypothetical protein
MMIPKKMVGNRVGKSFCKIISSARIHNQWGLYRFYALLEDQQSLLVEGWI